jgi:sn-glycerol 3-phosphate transport system permease protein
MLRQHLSGFPAEILDASRLDGKGPWTTLWRVIVPSAQSMTRTEGQNN